MTARIHPTAVVDAKAELAEGVEVGPYAVVGAEVVLGEGCVVGPHAVLTGPSRFGPQNRFYPGCAVGADPQDMKFRGERTTLEVGARNVFREYVTVSRGTEGGGGVTRIGSDCLLMAYVHVAHDCVIGDRTILANCVTLAGHVEIDADVIVGGLTPIHQFVRIGRGAFVGGMTRLSQDVTPFTRVAGVPPRVLGANRIGLERRGVEPHRIAAIQRTLSILYRKGLNTSDAMARVREEVEMTPDVEEILRFLAHPSKRGITR